jgi:hypothetical protein
MLMLMLIGGDLEAGILSQPTGNFLRCTSTEAYCASYRKGIEHSHYPHAYSARSIMGVRWEEKDG